MKKKNKAVRVLTTRGEGEGGKKPERCSDGEPASEGARNPCYMDTMDRKTLRSRCWYQSRKSDDSRKRTHPILEVCNHHRPNLVTAPQLLVAILISLFHLCAYATSLTSLSLSLLYKHMLGKANEGRGREEKKKEKEKFN